MTMNDWAEQFDGILRLSKREILDNAGSISADIAQRHALTEFEKFRVRQDRLFESDFDRFLWVEAQPVLDESSEEPNELEEASNEQD